MAGNDPFYLEVQKGLGDGESPADYITSIDVLATKPGAAGGCC